VSLAAAASDILLWWPAGSGAQHLYNVTVGLGHSAATQPYVTTTRSVGFRTLALVTGNDTDPSYVATAESEVSLDVA
jgi:beta-mannosidase